MLVVIGRLDYLRKEGRQVTQTLSDVVVLIIFVITVVNIFIATFGVDDERTTFLRWQAERARSSSEPLILGAGVPSISSSPVPDNSNVTSFNNRSTLP